MRHHFWFCFYNCTMVVYENFFNLVLLTFLHKDGSDKWRFYKKKSHDQPPLVGENTVFVGKIATKSGIRQCKGPFIWRNSDCDKNGFHRYQWQCLQERQAGMKLLSLLHYVNTLTKSNILFVLIAVAICLILWMGLKDAIASSAERLAKLMMNFHYQFIFWEPCIG